MPTKTTSARKKNSGAVPSASPTDQPEAITEERRAGAAEPGGKLGEMLKLLRRPEGASIADLSAATGWQTHSVRGAMSGALKKKAGLSITSEKTETGRVYRVVEAGA